MATIEEQIAVWERELKLAKNSAAYEVSDGDTDAARKYLDDVDEAREKLASLRVQFTDQKRGPFGLEPDETPEDSEPTYWITSEVEVFRGGTGLWILKGFIGSTPERALTELRDALNKLIEGK